MPLRTRYRMKHNVRGPNEPITVLLGEDAPLIRAALGKLLQGEDAVSVIGEVPTGELLDLARKLQPDVVVISAVYPLDRHLPIINSLLRLGKSPAVMMVSTYKRPTFLREFFSIGASACVLTGATTEIMLTAIRRIAAGRKYLDPDVSDAVIIALAGDRGRPRRGVLSAREEQTLELLARGYTIKEVAQKMRVSPSTVQTFHDRVAEKLDLHGRADFVRYALASGILNPDEECESVMEEERARRKA